MALTSLSLQRFIACWSRQDLATPISWSALAMNGSALSSSDTEGIHQRPQSVPSDNSCLLIEGHNAWASTATASHDKHFGLSESRESTTGKIPGDATERLCTAGDDLVGGEFN